MPPFGLQRSETMRERAPLAGTTGGDGRLLRRSCPASCICLCCGQKRRTLRNGAPDVIFEPTGRRGARRVALLHRRQDPGRDRRRTWASRGRPRSGWCRSRSPSGWCGSGWSIRSPAAWSWRQRLTERFGLVRAEVVPGDPDADGGTVGLGEAGAAEIARWLRRERPIVMAVGTGRTLKAAIDHLPPIELPAAPRGVADRQHRPGRVGGLLQRDLLDGRGGGGPALPDAAAGLRGLARGAGADARPGADPLDAGARGGRRRRFRRHRRDGRRGAALRRPLPDGGRARGGARPPARSARSAAGSSTATAGCCAAAPTSAPPARRSPTATARR